MSEEAADLHAKVHVLERQNRILTKKLSRSTQSRARLEDLKDKHELVMRKVISEVREAEQALEAKSRELTKANEELRTSLGQLKQAQDELIRSERLAALGRLVAGVAHEINTPLGVAVTACSLVREHITELRTKYEGGAMRKSDLRKFIADGAQATHMVEANLNRAAELVRNFKEVAVDQTSQERRSIKVASYLKEVLRSLNPMVRGTSVKIHVDWEEDIGMDTYPGAISQVVTNLVSNALAHAFDGADGGNIRFTITPEGEDQVRLVCEDDGCGMSQEVQRRIFEPFFTTRLGVGGSGLGMNIMHNLVNDVLGGKIQVWSEPGVGSRFIMLIPKKVNRDVARPRE